MATEYRYFSISMSHNQRTPNTPMLRIGVGKSDKLAVIPLTEQQLLDIAENALKTYRACIKDKAS